MIDVSAPDFDIDAIDLDTVTAADIAPLRKRHTDEDLRAWGKIHLAARENAERAAVAARERDPVAIAARRAAASTARAASDATKVAQAAEVRRCTLIMARAPSGWREEALAAIKAGHSLETFNASLPGELRGFMPPLDVFVADFDRAEKAKVAPSKRASTTAEDEAAAQSVLSAYRAANP